VPGEAQKKINATHADFLQKTTLDPASAEALLRAQADTEILPAIERSLAELLGKEQFQEFTAYGLALLQCRNQREAGSIPSPQFLNVLRGTIPKQNRPLRSQAAAWLLLKAFLMSNYQPFSNLRVLKWCNSENGNLNIAVKTHCCACSGLGLLLLHRLDATLRPFEARFNCSDCSHCFETRVYRPRENSPFEVAEMDRKKAVCCVCEFCRAQKAELLALLRRELEKGASQKLLEYKAWRLGLSQPPILRKTMFRDHELYKNDISKDLRAILALRPQTGDEFNTCISHYAEVRGGSRKVLREAVSRRVIYETRADKAPEYETFEDLLAGSLVPMMRDFRWRSATVHMQNPNGTAPLTEAERTLKAHKQASEQIVLPLFTAAEAEAQLRVTSSRIYFSFSDNWLLLHDSADLDRWSYGVLLEEKGINWSATSLLRAAIFPQPSRQVTLNHFFLDPFVSAKPAANMSHRRLFNSNTEHNAYRRLAGSSSDAGYIVIPNRVFYQLLTRDGLRDLEANHYRDRQDDWQYVRTCELDLVIYDSEGHLVAVEEVQRGDHHNHPEWIRKDGLKREALALAGIPFRESF
jgi:hypothetical protein